jgi:hypothetical protein
MTDLRNTPPPPSLITGVLSENKVIRRESADDYVQVLIQFYADCRLILCKHGRQCIVQVRSAKKPNVGTWVGRKHITSKAALLVVCSALHLIRDRATAEKVLALPDDLTGGSQNG